MNHLHNNEDSEEDYDSDSNSDTGSDSEASQHWHDALEWNLDRVGQLRDILKIWVEGDVPADEIGDFLVSCLYRCDEHLGYRLTRMVDERKTYAHIARVLIGYFQIRHDEDRPLWTQIRPGNPLRRPGRFHDADERQMGDCRTDDSHMDACAEKTTVVPHIVAPQPVRPVRWPLLLGDFEPEYLIQQGANGNGIELEGEIGMRCSQHNGLAIFGNTERKALVHTPGSDCDFEWQTAEMIIPPG